VPVFQNPLWIPPLPAGGTPSAPTAVTSVTADSSATVSFLAPASAGSSPVTSYTATPYIAGVAQTPVTTLAGSAGSITGSNGGTYVQIPVTGLTNATAYTFTVHASNTSGAGAESAASGANTPLSGLVFGDDFNGPSGGAIDPEWWVYTRCGYLAQSEVEYYLPSQVAIDGNGNLALTAVHTSYTGPDYPSDTGYPKNVTQPWQSGAVQSNTRTYVPATGNTMTFEVRQQLCADAGNGFWPGLFWLEGYTYLDAWKTDPLQQGWDSSGKAEIDVAEWFMSGSANSYGTNVYTGASYQHSVTSSGLATSMHTFQARWKPGASVSFWQDGSQTGSTTSSVPDATSSLFLLIYLQMLAGGPTTTESCLIDHVRVFDQNLG
jgi:hypothetical protein